VPSRKRIIFYSGAGVYTGSRALQYLGQLAGDYNISSYTAPPKTTKDAIALFEKLPKKAGNLWLFREKRGTNKKQSRYVWQLRKLGYKPKRRGKPKLLGATRGRGAVPTVRFTAPTPGPTEAVEAPPLERWGNAALEAPIQWTFTDVLQQIPAVQGNVQRNRQEEAVREAVVRAEERAAAEERRQREEDAWLLEQLNQVVI
jgi:hypothetical protein